MSDADYALTVKQGEPVAILEEATTPESDSLFAAAMAAVGATPTEPTPTPDPAPAASTQEQPPAPAEVKAEPAPEQPAEKPPERVAPGLLKIMEREAAVIAGENRLKEAQADLQALREQVARVEQAQNKFKYDPVGFIRSLAPDANLADLAKQLWYEQLGDGAPADYRATREARAAKLTVEELRAEFDQKIEAEKNRWAEEIQRKEAETAYHQYVGAIGAFATSVPDEYPLVKSFAASDPARVQQGLLKIAQKHAQATGGEVLSPAECAAKLNKELDKLRTALGVNQPAPATPAPTPTTTAPVSTLRNKHTSIQPNRAVPDPNDEEAKFLAALEAARSIPPG